MGYAGFIEVLMPHRAKNPEIKTPQDWARENKTTQRIAYALILGCVLVFAMGQTVLFVLLQPISREIGFDESWVGWIVALSAASMALIQPTWGRVSDKWGRKAVIIFGLLAYAITTALFAFILQVGLWGWVAPLPLLAMLILARLAYGLTSSGIQPAASAFVADTTTGKKRTQGLAMVGAAVGLGTVAGPLFGMVLVGFGDLVPLYAAAILALVMGLVGFRYLKEPPAHVRPTPTTRLKVSDPRILPYLIMTLLVLVVVAATQQTAAYYVQDRLNLVTVAETARLTGYAMAGTAVMAIIFQGAVVQWLKPAPAVLVRSGFLIGTTAFVFLSLTKSYEGLVIGYMILGASIGLLNPGMMSAASMSVEPEEQGGVAGWIGSAMSAGFVFGPILGTNLYNVGQVAPMKVNAAIMGVMLVGSMFLAFGPRPKSLDPQPMDPEGEIDLGEE